VIPGAMRLQPRSRSRSIQAVAEARELVFNKGIQWIED